MLLHALALCAALCTAVTGRHRTRAPTHLPPADHGAVRVRSNMDPSSSHNPSAPFLPPPPPTNDSMLLMINTYSFNASTSRVTATLENAVDWCDTYAQHVHVVLYTSSPALADYVFSPDNRFFCRRAARVLPIAVLQYDANVTIFISAYHRYLVAHVAADYGWYMYSEDDVAYRWSHVAYLRTWAQAMQGTPYVPHLMRYEVMPVSSTALVDATQSRAALVLDEHPLPLIVRRVPYTSTPLIILPNPYMALWHLPRAAVQHYASQPSWLADAVHCPSSDPRVYYATFWLRPHTNLTVPVVNAASALVQHVSTHYVSEAAGAMVAHRSHDTHPLFVHRWYNTDALDFVAHVEACVAADNAPSHTPHAYIQRPATPLDGRCARCLDAGRDAMIECVQRTESMPLRYEVRCV